MTRDDLDQITLTIKYIGAAKHRWKCVSENFLEN